MKNPILIQRIQIKIISPLSKFFKDSRSVGIILIASTLLSLLLANSPWKIPYLSILSIDPVPFFQHSNLPHNLLQWVNDGLMAIFFFWVGLEIKRELVVGELSSLKKSLLPILAAFGGMVFPAIIFLIFNHSTPFHHGWAIPIATDIAFSLGILSLLGKRIPQSLKIFLMALAIIDDLGAILAIAIFYSHSYQLNYLIYSGVILTIIIIIHLFKVKYSGVYLIPGFLLWYCLLKSGIHPTLAGVFLALLFPISKVSPWANALERPVNFFILPLFALTNTAISISAHLLGGPFKLLGLGIFWGLVLGKPFGILLACFIATRMKWAVLPSRTSWGQMLGIGFLAGIGFTMSIFFSTLAFHQNSYQQISKITVLVSSCAAGALGFVLLKFGKT